MILNDFSMKFDDFDDFSMNFDDFSMKFCELAARTTFSASSATTAGMPARSWAARRTSPGEHWAVECSRTELGMVHLEFHS